MMMLLSASSELWKKKRRSNDRFEINIPVDIHRITYLYRLTMNIWNAWRIHGQIIFQVRCEDYTLPQLWAVFYSFQKDCSGIYHQWRHTWIVWLSSSFSTTKWLFTYTNNVPRVRIGQRDDMERICSHIFLSIK